MIDHELRRTGISGSEVAAIIGLNPRADAFDVYQQKVSPMPRQEPTARMVWGKRVEKVIAEAYAEETNQLIRWWDTTVANPKRPWQIATVDAFVIDSDHADIGIVDAKNVAFDQQYMWGEPGTADVPESIGCQMQWYCDCHELPWADLAALFGGYDLRLYRVTADAELQAWLRDAAENFLHDHVIPEIPPPIGCTDAARAYLRQRFPKHVSKLRDATPEEVEMIEELRKVKINYRRWEDNLRTCENALKERIGEAEGLLFAGDKVTWKADKPSYGIDWEQIARLECPDERRLQQLIADYQKLTREPARKLITPRHWMSGE